MLICPVCKERLIKNDHGYDCINNHHFDIAKEGYVNLLLANQKRSSEPGDSIESANSRKLFLEHNYYQNLSDEINGIVDKYLDKDSNILDAGVGTGYYLKRLIKSRNNGDQYYGIDIGKKEAKLSKKDNPEATIMVGSVFRMPLLDNSMDLILSVFTPYSNDEFYRVCSKNGYVIAVQPGKRHLYELKELIYQNPYENNKEGYNLNGFNLIEVKELSNKIMLLDTKMIMTLFDMTPYAHKTSKEDLEKIKHINELELTTEFLISIYQRK